MLRMGGGCQGCGMADVTLRQGIEGMLARLVPAVRGIVTSPTTPRSQPVFPGIKMMRVRRADVCEAQHAAYTFLTVRLPRLLLLLPTTTYRTAAFVEAARRIG